MRILCCWISLMFIILLMGAGKSQSGENLVNGDQAENLINEYFNMLKDGYTMGIMDLLTGPMLKSNENLLQNNPRYSMLLRERYRSSSFLIAGYTRISSSKAAVDVVIRFNSQEEIRVRFILLGENDRLKIYAEEELASLMNSGK